VPAWSTRSWSGSYARAGYLKTLVRRRARNLGAGATRRVKPRGLPIARVRGPVERRRDGLLVARVRPGSRRSVVVNVVLCQSRVAASQQNAASSRAHAIATVPVRLPRVSARCVQRS
jgi:hypothetical protein